MKNIQLFVATLLCAFTIQFAHANSVNYTPVDPTCHCCATCDDKKCQEMCASLEELKKDDSKKEEAKALAEKCEAHCKTVKCDMKSKNKKSCCASH